MSYILVNETQPDLIAGRIVVKGSTVARLGEDDPDPANAMSDVSITTEMPGGHQGFKCKVGRDPELQWSDMMEFAEFIAYRPGFNPVFEGFFDKDAPLSEESRSMSPEFLGWQAALNDDNAIRVGYIDTDLTKWGDPSLAQRKRMLEGTWSGAGGNQLCVESGSGLTANNSAGIHLTLGHVLPGRTPVGQMWYYGDGVEIGQIIFDSYVTPASLGGDANMYNRIYYSTDEVESARFLAFEAHQSTVSGYGAGAVAAGTGYKYVVAEMLYATSLPENDYTNTYSFENIKVVSTYGLGTKGTWPNIGYSAQQILVHFINNFCAPLTTNQDAISDDGFIIPQAWYGNSSRSEVVKDVLKYGLYDWFVYSNKKFEVREPGSYGKRYKAYVAPSQLNESGKDSQRLWRSITVRFTEANGTVRTIGRPGSNSDYQSPGLEITDLDHPAVRAERTRNDLLDIQGIATPETARAVGERFLEEASLLNRSGSATLNGYIQDDRGTLWPVSVVRAGDYISFCDAADKSYRKIVRTNYSGDQRSNEIDLDAPPSGLEALLERLQVALIPLGVS